MFDSDAILKIAAELRRAGKAFVLATVVRCELPTSAKPGAKAIVEPDGSIHGWIGGGCAQPAVIKAAKKSLREGRPYLVRISPHSEEVVEEGVLDFGMRCHSGGTLDIFIEPLGVQPRVLIIGVSPTAQALSDLAARLGFSVIAAFPGADRDAFPDAMHIFDNLELEGAGIGPHDFVVVATQGRKDEEGLEAALSTGAGFIAFVGSRRKADKLRQYLKERGHPSERVDTISAPAGLDLGGVTPAEIALSIVADLVQRRRKISAGTGQPDVPVEEEVAPAMALDPVCGMQVNPATVEHRSLHAGQAYYFCCAGCKHEFDKAPDRYMRKTASRL